MDWPSAQQKSRWLGPALGAGIGTGLVASGFGELAPSGRRFGGWLGNVIKTATGFGEYNIRQNSLYEGAQVPFVENRPTVNGTTISHREYVMDVITSPVPGAFHSEQFYINPALSTTFEWMAQIAANYEEYILEGMLFVFRSMSADALNSTNTALGNVVMATQYNTYQPIFSNKAEMESHAYSMSCKPSQDMVHPIECDPHQSSITTFFTRNGLVPDGADRRLYDVGRFEIATCGFQAASVNIGELHITYQVTLMKPRLWSALGRGQPYYHGFNTTWLDATEPLGTLPMQKTASSTFEPTITYGTPGATVPIHINFLRISSPQIYKIDCYQQDGGIPIKTGISSTAVTNCQDVTTGYIATNLNQPESSLAATYHHWQRIVKTDGDYKQAEIILQAILDPAVGGAQGEVHLFITQLPNN